MSHPEELLVWLRFATEAKATVNRPTAARSGRALQFTAITSGDFLAFTSIDQFEGVAITLWY
jgi:hypothetical protein